MKNKTYALSYNKQPAQFLDLFIDEIIQGNKVTKNILSNLKTGDILVVDDIQALGDTFDEIIDALNDISENGINLCLLAENLSFTADKLPEFVSSLVIASKIHRNIISLTTKKALKSVKLKGKKLGHPFGKSLTKKLDNRKDEIRQMLADGVSKADIARRYNVCWKTVSIFIKNNPELLSEKHDG